MFVRGPQSAEDIVDINESLLSISEEVYRTTMDVQVLVLAFIPFVARVLDQDFCFLSLAWLTPCVNDMCGTLVRFYCFVNPCSFIYVPDYVDFSCVNSFYKKMVAI